MFWSPLKLGSLACVRWHGVAWFVRPHNHDESDEVGNYFDGNYESSGDDEDGGHDLGDHVTEYVDVRP